MRIFLLLNTGLRMRWRFVPGRLSHSFRLPVVVVVHEWSMRESVFRSWITLRNKRTLPRLESSRGLLMSGRLPGRAESGMLSTGVPSRRRLRAEQALQRIRSLYKSVLTAWSLRLQRAVSCNQQTSAVFLSAGTLWQSKDQLQER